ncbi:MAG: hypothetical protein RSA29_06110 [Clostridium sp.]
MNRYGNSDEEIIRLRSIIKNLYCHGCKVIKMNDINNITIHNILVLLKLYDNYIFKDNLSNLIDSNIKISLSNRMTSSGGKTIFNKISNIQRYEIRISMRILEKFISDNKNKVICGIEGKDVIDALMLILEHEICHVLEFSIYGNSNCRGDIFKIIAYDIFKHKSSYHEILKDSSKIISENYFKKGQIVNFIYKNKKYEGVIKNINKRATVMVKNGEDIYESNYTKWYVPLNLLINK